MPGFYGARSPKPGGGGVKCEAAGQHEHGRTAGSEASMCTSSVQGRKHRVPAPRATSRPTPSLSLGAGMALTSMVSTALFFSKCVLT